VVVAVVRLNIMFAAVAVLVDYFKPLILPFLLVLL
jgi:hypothetical protein